MLLNGANSTERSIPGELNSFSSTVQHDHHAGSAGAAHTVNNVQQTQDKRKLWACKYFDVWKGQGCGQVTENLSDVIRAHKYLIANRIID